jgi:hypothetical protein
MEVSAGNPTTARFVTVFEKIETGSILKLLSTVALDLGVHSCSHQ